MTYVARITRPSKDVMKKRFVNYKTDEFWQIKVAGNLLVTTQGWGGTLGKTSISTFVSEKKCLKEAERLLLDRKKEGYSENRMDCIKRPELPPILREALVKSKVIKSPTNKFELFPLENVMFITVTVNRDPAAEVVRPNSGNANEGVFCHPVYALGCDFPKGQNPEHFLVWLPESGLYGMWYKARCELYVFPGADWAAVESDLSNHVDTNSVCLSFPRIQDHLVIEDHFTFIPNDLAKQIDYILSLSGSRRLQKVEEFLVLFEEKLLSLPYSNALEREFKSLITLYYHIGQWLEADSDFVAAIQWFEKSLLIMNQTVHFRKLFSDIFLQLSFCYLEIKKHDLSLLYIDLFGMHDPSSQEACGKIRDSIIRTQVLYKDTMNAYLKHITTKSDRGFKRVNELTRRALESAPQDPVLHFNLACFYSSSNRLKEALYHLEEAFKKGYKNHEMLIQDEDLENVRRTREFEDIRLKYLFVIC